MNEEEILDEFRTAGALLEGHFVLSSGLHSPAYLQCARVLMDAKRAARLCSALADKVRHVLAQADCIISPAMGGVVVGYEMGRQLSLPAMFMERVEGAFTLRRGFELAKNMKCLMVEDIVTTGLSSLETIATIKEYGGDVVGACCLIDRSNGTADIGVELVSLAQMQIPTYAVDDLPAELAAIEPTKPGSRNLKVS